MSQNGNIELLTCHCKKIKIELKLDQGLQELVRCNCSLCKRRGSIMAKIELKNLKIIEGEDKLSSYKFGKKEHAEHFFCSICGIYTHHRSFTNPENYEFNVACIDNVDTFIYENIPVFNGNKL
tara:strand:- start:826 stop:1194 length:369 start_codon:yes stop_codon:yes gene_type:complete